MGKKTTGDTARDLLLTGSEREAHAEAVQALLARNASMRTNDELIEDELRADPAFRGEWKRTALGRAVATALVRHRAEHDLSQRELADHLRTARLEIARLELGDVDPTMDTVMRITARLGIKIAIDAERDSVE
jgi:ribosome-binding protein aMBF1 (putative translation factor)